MTKYAVLISILLMKIFAFGSDQFLIQDNEKCPAGYSEVYQGYATYCRSNNVKKVLDTVLASNNNCPAGYQLVYRGYSEYCELSTCVVRQTGRGFAVNDNVECPQGYTKSYQGYSSYCKPADIPADNCPP